MPGTPPASADTGRYSGDAIRRQVDEAGLESRGRVISTAKTARGAASRLRMRGTRRTDGRRRMDMVPRMKEGAG
jgi:hypothetical protein